MVFFHKKRPNLFDFNKIKPPEIRSLGGPGIAEEPSSNSGGEGGDGGEPSTAAVLVRGRGGGRRCEGYNRYITREI